MTASGDRTALMVLRGGVAFVFLYAAVAMVVQPDDFIGYFPSFMGARTDADLLLAGFALYEMAIAAGILSGRYTYPASLLATATLAAIVVVNVDAFDVLFRNVAIACATLAIALETRPSRGRRLVPTDPVAE